MSIDHPIVATTVPLMLFMFVSSITPGPNNLMLMNSGIRFGLRRTLPHAIGVTTGLAVVMTLSYVGVGALLFSRPALLRLMTLVCALYLLWLAAGLLRSTGIQLDVPAADGSGKNLRAMKPAEAILFQFINPKVWMMTLTASSIAANFPFSPLSSLVVLVLLSSLVNLPCVSVWAIFGDRLRLQLRRQRFRSLFNASMALLVVLTAAWMAIPAVA